MSVKQDIDRRIYHIEVLTPKQNTEDLEGDLQKFSDKYNQVMDAGYVVCITDNPMGNVSFQATDVIPELGLPAKPGQLSIHLNTFHTKEEDPRPVRDVRREGHPRRLGRRQRTPGQTGARGARPDVQRSDVR